LLSTAAAAAGLSTFPLRRTAAAERTGRKALYFTRHCVYSLPALPSPLKPLDGPSLSDKVLMEIGKRAGVAVDCTNNGEVFDGDLDQYGAFVFFTSGTLEQLMGPSSTQGTPPISPRGKNRLFAALAAGAGFVGIRNTVSCSEELIGCLYNGHVYTQKGLMLVTSPSFPGVERIGKSFSVVDPWYTFRNFSQDLHVILVQDTEAAKLADVPPDRRELQKKMHRPPFPATWARQRGESRVFYTSMGNFAETWNDPAFQDILLGAINWTMGRVDADATPNIDKAAPQANRLQW
jgi:hypothetical protein